MFKLKSFSTSGCPLLPDEMQTAARMGERKICFGGLGIKMGKHLRDVCLIWNSAEGNIKMFYQTKKSRSLVKVMHLLNKSMQICSNKNT